MVNIYIPVCGLFLSILILIIFYSKQKMKNVETKLFSYLIMANFINAILTVIIIYFGYKTPNNIRLFIFLNKIDYLTYIIWISSFFLYIFHISFNKKPVYIHFNKITKFVYFIGILLYIIMLFLPINIFNDGYMYSYGSAITTLYICVGIYVLLIITILIINYRSLTNKKYIPLYVLIIIILITMLVRRVNPGLLVISSVVAYVDLIMYFTIENPDMKLLKEMHDAKEISDNANEEKTLFLYNMTQEIRATTKNIDTEADIIIDSDSIDMDKDSARNIKRETAKFRTMTNDILDVSAIDASSIKIYNSVYNVKVLLKSLISNYTEISKNKNIEFRTNIEHNIPEYLYGDSISLKRAINLLLTYSVKNTNKGYVELNLNTIIKNDIVRLIITIEDSSMGIKSDELEKIK